MSLHNWSGRRVAAISASWIILVVVFFIWREFSTAYVSRLRGTDDYGFVVISERPSTVTVSLAALVPPLILLLVWGRSGKQRN